MSTYTPNYNLEKPGATDPFGNFRQLFNDNMDKIDQIGGGGSGGHTIYDPDGNALAQESGLQFTGAVNVTDDALNGRTVVDVSGGSNLILDAQIYSTEEKQVGVWIDNKPLYCKTVQTAIPNNSQASYSHNIADIDTIVRIEGGAWGSNQLLPINMTGYVYNNNEGALRVTVTKTHVVVMPLGWDGSGYTGLWNIYYTKTTDVAGSGGYEAYGFSPVIYSDVERCIGVWRDNKPLYQKTIKVANVGSISSSGSTVITINDIPFDTLLITNANIYDTSDNRRYDVPNLSSYSPDRIFSHGYLSKSSNPVVFYYSLYSGGYTYSSLTDLNVTIQYTKTTDVAGSGDYNTYGVPTVHYDTNEQVIGTWITGKPLYEITVEVNSVAYNDWTDVFYLADADIKGYDSRTSYAQLNNGERVQLDWFVTTSIYNRSIITNSGTKFRVETQGNNYSKIVATIQYTKTTD